MEELTLPLLPPLLLDGPPEALAGPPDGPEGVDPEASIDIDDGGAPVARSDSLPAPVPAQPVSLFPMVTARAVARKFLF